MDWTTLGALLLEPFQYAFIRRGLLEALMMGCICGAMGAFVVARGWGFIGDAISHSIFPGVVIAYLAKFNFALGALLFGVLTALGIGAISRHSRLKEDTAIGVLFAGAFALGIVLISTTRSYASDLSGILFGNILGVSDTDLLVTFGLGLLVFAVLFVTYKELLLVAFDRTMAEAMGLRVAWLDQLLLLLLTLTIIISLQAVGNILVVAMLITPAATARLFVQRFHTLMALGATIGALCGVTGLYASYYLNMASGGIIVLTATLVFGLAFLFAPGQGVLAQRRRWRGGALGDA